MSEQHKFIYHWQDGYSLDIQSLGGKGWNLCRLAKYGFPIPKGIVLPIKAYETFIEENNLADQIIRLSEEIDLDHRAEAEKKLLLLQKEIQNGVIPEKIAEQILDSLKELKILDKSLAVRSSASAEDGEQTSFAGIHESFLNVVGIESLFESIKDCYASLWTLRALSYRRKMNIKDSEIGQGVVIMEMIDSHSAGIGFTCDPLTGRPKVIVINANYGLGEAVVGGQVEPDQYKVLVEDFEPILQEKTIGSKKVTTRIRSCGGTEIVSLEATIASNQVLDNNNIIRLSLLLQRVYDAFGEGKYHQDVEWVFDGKDFLLVQARPVTSLPRYTYPELKQQGEIWSNANIKDALPMVQTTFGGNLTKKLSEGILKSPIKLVGYNSLPGLEYMKLIEGRGYFNLSLIQWEFYDVFGVHPRETNELMGGHQPEIEIVESKAEQKRKAFKRNLNALKLFSAFFKAQKEAKVKFKIVTDYTNSLIEKDLTPLTKEEILLGLQEGVNKAIEFTPTIAMLSNSAGALLNTLAKILEKDFPKQGYTMANKLLLGQGNITSAEQGYKLLKLADIAKKDSATYNYFSSDYFDPHAWKKELVEGSPFKVGFQDFLEEFGHRAVYEGEIANPRWREDPSYLLTNIKEMLKSIDYDIFKENQQTRYRQSWSQIKAKVPRYRFPLVRWLVKKAIKGAEMREISKSHLVRFAEATRILALELGRRFTEDKILEGKEDIFYCSWVEIVSILKGHWKGEGLAFLVQERKAKKLLQEQLKPVDVVVDEKPFQKPEIVISAKDHLVGLGVASGKAKGKARLILHPEEGTRLQQGEVLVAPSTDPGWTPLFLKASAIVMETGGFLSHGAIVAREYGIPAVVNIPGVMQLIEEGCEIIVDGDEGKVYITKNS